MSANVYNLFIKYKLSREKKRKMHKKAKYLQKKYQSTMSEQKALLPMSYLNFH